VEILGLCARISTTCQKTLELASALKLEDEKYLGEDVAQKKLTNNISKQLIVVQKSYFAHKLFFVFIKFNMQRLFKKCLAISLSMAGAMIGVGLASGREVVSFFARFGFFSPLLCLFSGIIFFVLCFLIFEISKKNVPDCEQISFSVTNQSEIQGSAACKPTHHSSAKKRGHLGFQNITLAICQISLCCAMFAGLMSVFSRITQSYILKFLLLILVLVVAFFIISSGKKMVFSINFFLALSLFIFLIIVFILKLCSRQFDAINGTKFKAYSPLFGALYSGMNILTIYPLLESAGKDLTTRRERILASFFIGFAISIILVMLCLFILIFGGQNLGSEMIMINIIEDLSPFLAGIYMTLMSLCIFSTLLSTAYGSVSCMDQRKPKKQSFAISLLIAFALSFVGFSNIVDFIYPALGLICVIKVTVEFVFMKRKNKAHKK